MRCEGERPNKRINRVQCPKCSKNISANALSDHLKLHKYKETGVWPHNCPHCGKGFQSKRNKDRHVEGEVCLRQAEKKRQKEQKLFEL